MNDELLFAFEATIRSAGLGYDAQTCRVMGDGHPPANCGKEFVAVSTGSSSSDAVNCMDERQGLVVTLTRRVNVPLDRVGDAELAKKLARRRAPGDKSFNARCAELKDILHQDWATLQVANTLLCAWATEQVVNGFCEPARYAGADPPRFEGPLWFGADPASDVVGLVRELRFEGCRRIQPIADYVE